MPIIQEQIKLIYYKKELSRTLNSMDCIARGAALQAAMLNSNFQTAQFEIEEFNKLPISISYKLKDHKNVSTKELFCIGSNFPASKSLTFENKLGGCDLLIHYSDKAHILNGLPNQIAQYEIAEGKPEQATITQKNSFMMKIQNNIHNIAYLEQAYINSEWTEEGPKG